MSPFGRLALANGISSAGDVFLTVVLAASTFIKPQPGQAEWKVLFALLFTMLPFIVLAPILGPALDRSRHGRRTLMAIGFAGRAILMVLMSGYLDSIVLYPLALGCLALGKGHSVARAALMPALVADEAELVRANSRMAVISAATVVIAAPLATLLAITFDAPGSALILGGIVMAAGCVFTWRIPQVETIAAADRIADVDASAVPHSVRVSILTISMLRFGVGFLTFFAAFSLKAKGATLADIAKIAVFYAVGLNIASLLSPLARKKMREETMISVSICIPAMASLVLARDAGTAALTMSQVVIGFGAQFGQLAFDSLTQRDLPDEIRARSFARFETRFQAHLLVGQVAGVILSSWLDTKVVLFVLTLTLSVTALLYIRDGHIAPRSERQALANDAPSTPTSRRSATSGLAERILKSDEESRSGGEFKPREP